MFKDDNDSNIAERAINEDHAKSQRKLQRSRPASSQAFTKNGSIVMAALCVWIVKGVLPSSNERADIDSTCGRFKASEQLSPSRASARNVQNFIQGPQSRVPGFAKKIASWKLE